MVAKQLAFSVWVILFALYCGRCRRRLAVSIDVEGSNRGCIVSSPYESQSGVSRGASTSATETMDGMTWSAKAVFGCDVCRDVWTQSWVNAMYLVWLGAPM